MNLEDIKSLVKKGESETLEFKTSTGEIRAACQTLCAFLNGKGGTVLIGVEDRGKIIGQNISDKTQQEMAREISKLEPHADIDVTYVSLDDRRQVILITAGQGENAPYVYDDRPFFRALSSTSRMPREKYERLIQEKRPSSISWEKLTLNDATLIDLDETRIQQVVDIAVKERRLSKMAIRADTKEILKKLNLIVDDKLRNASVILFCKNEDHQFIQAQLKMARFRGINKNEFIDNKAVRGNIFDLYESAMSFLESYLPVSGKIEVGNPFRVDTLAIPYEVLREALVNALCHRDYSSPGGSISLAIYDDRVEIGNTGRLPEDITLKDLTKEHESHPRNPLIAEVLFACKMIERWGRGTQDIVDFCKKAGNPKPKFVEMTGSFTVVLPFKEPIGGGYTEKKPIELTERQREILKILEKSPYNSAQIAEKIKNFPSRRIVQLDLTKLEKQGLVKREGESRSISWKLAK